MDFYLQKGADEIVGNLFKYLNDECKDGKELKVTVKEGKLSRSDAQRRLVNAWYDQWSNQTGTERNRIRNQIMYKCGIPIFYRDNIEVNGAFSCDTIDCIKRVKAAGMIAEYNQMMMGFAANATSSSFGVKQNSDYIDNIDKLAIDQGITLFVPGGLELAGFKP